MQARRLIEVARLGADSPVVVARVLCGQQLDMSVTSTEAARLTTATTAHSAIAGCCSRGCDCDERACPVSRGAGAPVSMVDDAVAANSF